MQAFDDPNEQRCRYCGMPQEACDCVNDFSDVDAIRCPECHREVDIGGLRLGEKNRAGEEFVRYHVKNCDAWRR